VPVLTPVNKLDVCTHHALHRDDVASRWSVRSVTRSEPKRRGPTSRESIRSRLPNTWGRQVFAVEERKRRDTTASKAIWPGRIASDVASRKGVPRRGRRSSLPLPEWLLDGQRPHAGLTRQRAGSKARPRSVTDVAHTWSRQKHHPRRGPQVMTTVVRDATPEFSEPIRKPSGIALITGDD
jgi:hypothetical protein